jgi:NAD(P)-dependent dehydrogenase (short-subunit alcohol dehydrogenase family)
MSREIAVVAGATGALGSAISTALRERGLDVLGLARHGSDRESFLEVDLRDDDSVAAVGGRIEGVVRAVVHVAGPPLAGSVENVDTASVLEAFDVKVNGLLRLVRAVDSHLVDGSRIVAVTGHLGYDPVPASVSAGVANAALAALVRQLAGALGPRGVTCHAVAPGPVESPRVDRLLEHLATTSRTSREEARAKLLAEASVGRFATPEDVAWAVSLLLDDAAAVMNGSTIFLDGGRRTAIP